MEIKVREAAPRETRTAGGRAIRGRLLAKNTIYNLLGQVIPMIAAFLAIPVLIRALGAPRFGVLSLAWMVVGYFGLFDMGVGRATTKFVAENLAAGQTRTVSKLIWTSMGMLGAFGLFAGITLALSAHVLATRLLNVPQALRPETVKAFRMLALSLPFVLGTAGTRGVLAAQQRFGTINAIKAPASVASFIIPIVVVRFTNSLYPITAALVAGRVIVFMIYFYFCLKWTPGMRKWSLPGTSLARKMLGFGTWVTISNVVSPLMDYMDRFVIGAMLTMSAVAYYCTPFDMVSRLWIIPGSLMGVAFPVFSATFGRDPARFATLYERASKYAIMGVAPVSMALVVMARPLLSFWIGREFASHGTAVLQILAIGVFINASAQAPYTAIQGMGRPDLTAKFHLLELPIYITVLRLAVPAMGITGAALAWTLRNTVDAVLLHWCAGRMMPAERKRSGYHAFAFPLLLAVMAMSVFLTRGMRAFGPRLAYLLCLLPPLFWLLWRFLMDPEEKALFTGFFCNLL